MDVRLVLALLNLNRIGRATVLKKLNLNSEMTCSLECIRSILKNGLKEKADSYSDDDIVTSIEKADKILSDVRHFSANVVTYWDPDYPYRLKDLKDPPVVLYYKGNIAPLNSKKTMAVIGTREPSKFGYKISEKIGSVSKVSDLVIVGGLAIGCDTGGHKGAIEAGGLTTAVMATGFEKIYPEANTGLAEQIVNTGGCLLTEYPPYSFTTRSTFVDRDRIQAGLSDGVFLVETGITGGSMHAVGVCLDLGRPLGCFDHPDEYKNFEKAQGNQKLINEKKGIPIDGNEALFKYIESLNTWRHTEHFEQLDLFNLGES